MDSNISSCTRSQARKKQEGPTARCILLLLPNEVLLHIAQQLSRCDVPDAGLTRFSRPKYSTLGAFSQSHSQMHSICVSAGMYTRVTPCRSRENSMSMRHFRQFGDLLCKGNGGPPLTSLGIDLSNSSVWDMCAQIMTAIPDLNELCFTGMTRTKDFQDTKLGSSCANFNGTSLVLRHATFTDMYFAILLHLRRTTITSLILDKTITSLILDKTRIATEPNQGGMWWDPEIRQLPGIDPGTPFFPNLERVKYTGLSRYGGLTEMTLGQCFIAGSRLKHCEVGSFGDEESLSPELEYRNPEYVDMRFYLLFVL